MRDWSQLTVHDVELSIRTTGCIDRWRPGITLGELDKMPNDMLLGIRYFGRKSLIELREMIKYLRTPKMEAELEHWVYEHRSLIFALMRGEAVIVLKDKAE